MREFKRSQRVADLIQHEVSSILLLDITDPRVEMVTVTGVKVSDDLSHAIVFYSVIGDDERWSEVKAGLASSRGYVKRELGRRVKMKHIPDVKFCEDRTLEQGGRIDDILSHLDDGRTDEE
jgi:ribosome-binding factor A